jgi:hypothetical protein
MVKKVRQTMVITVIETWTITWTITWADGTSHTVTYHTKQVYQPLPITSGDPQSAKNLEGKCPDPEQDKQDSGSSE